MNTLSCSVVEKDNEDIILETERVGTIKVKIVSIYEGQAEGKEEVQGKNDEKRLFLYIRYVYSLPDIKIKIKNKNVYLYHKCYKWFYHQNIFSV